MTTDPDGNSIASACNKSAWNKAHVDGDNPVSHTAGSLQQWNDVDGTTPGRRVRHGRPRESRAYLKLNFARQVLWFAQKARASLQVQIILNLLQILFDLTDILLDQLAVIVRAYIATMQRANEYQSRQKRRVLSVDNLASRQF